MDIKALIAGLTGKPQGNNSSPKAEPGAFEQVLNEKQQVGDLPPPGPEPPPPANDNAEEGVANIEQKTHAQKPDFSPHQEKDAPLAFLQLPDVDIELSEGFWENSAPAIANAEGEATDPSKHEQIIAWLASQFGGAFGAQNLGVQSPAVNGTEVSEAAKAQVNPIAETAQTISPKLIEAIETEVDLTQEVATEGEGQNKGVFALTDPDAATPAKETAQVGLEGDAAAEVEALVADEEVTVKVDLRNSSEKQIKGGGEAKTQGAVPVDGVKAQPANAEGAQSSDINVTGVANQKAKSESDTASNSNDSSSGNATLRQDAGSDKVKKSETGVQGQESKKDVDSNTETADVPTVQFKDIRADASNKPDSAGLGIGSQRSEAISHAKPFDANVNALNHADTRSVIQQITDRLEMLAATRPKDGVTIHLDPVNLGKVTMIIKSAGSSIDAKILASHDGVRHALEANQAQLSQAMDHRGFQLNSMTIGSQSAEASAHGQSQQAKEQFQQQAQNNVPRFVDSESGALMPDRDQFRLVSRKDTGIDLWI